MNMFTHWIKLAFRNILKSRRRTFVTLMAVGFGFASIALFQGYIHSIYEGLRASAIHGSGIGHLTLYAKGWEAHGKSDPEAYMITGPDMEIIMALAKENPPCGPGQPEAVRIGPGVQRENLHHLHWHRGGAGA